MGNVMSAVPPTLQAELDQHLEKFPQEQRDVIRDAISENTRLISEKMKTQNHEMMTLAVEEWKKSQEPPSAEDVQKLLDGEAPVFLVKFEIKGQKKSFRIRELPARVEKQVIRMMKDILTPKLGLLGQLTTELLEGTVTDKVTAFFEILEPATGLVSETVALVLTHSQDGEEPAIKYSADDVDENLSLQKQILVLNAQMAANRLRDFFSHVSRLIK